MNTPTGIVAAVSLSLIVAAGCAKQVQARPPATAVVETTSSRVQPAYAGNSISVSGPILAACNITLNNIDRAPKFDFDRSVLVAQDRDVLIQVAACVTSGPLKGHSLKLVGRADPRGETEYNFVLGGHRADSVASYLSDLGVNRSTLIETSRGKLDALGTDERGWQRDRRVDLVL